MHQSIAKIQMRIQNERNKIRKQEDVMGKGFTFQELFDQMIAQNRYLKETDKKQDQDAKPGKSHID